LVGWLVGWLAAAAAAAVVVIKICHKNKVITSHNTHDSSECHILQF
jgi:hypothetical protein